MEREIPVSRSIRFTAVFGSATLFLMAAQPAASQSTRGPVREGNRLFADGRYDEARQHYLDALREDPNSAVIRFNEGNALYESTAFREALDAYRQAIASGDQSLQAKAWYNLGNAFYRQQMYQESAEAYRQALRTDPNDIDAKHNLEWVRKQMEEQPGRQDQEDDQNQNGNEDQQPQDQEQQQDEREQGERQQNDQNDGEQAQGPQDEPQEGDGQQPPPMTREEAERLLSAINEGPNDLRRPQPARGARVATRKPW